MLTDDDEVVAAYAYCNLHSIWKNQENWNKKDSMHPFLYRNFDLFGWFNITIHETAKIRIILHLFCC